MVLSKKRLLLMCQEASCTQVWKQELPYLPLIENQAVLATAVITSLKVRKSLKWITFYLVWEWFQIWISLLEMQNIKVISGGYSFPLCQSMTHVDIFIQKRKKGKKNRKRKEGKKIFECAVLVFNISHICLTVCLECLC